MTPVPFELTDVGRAVVRYRTLTTAEAAAYVGVGRAAVWEQARVGRLPGVQVDGNWLFDLDDVEAYAARRRARLSGESPRRQLPVPRVDAGPLLRQIELRGGDYALGVRIGSADKRALERAREDGTLTVWAADRLTVRLLGLTPWEVWGEEYASA
jgi:excisionase family DNA binding protein